MLRTFFQRLTSYLQTRKRKTRYSSLSRRDVFTSIFKDKTWTKGFSNVPVSGGGSALEYTNNIRGKLERVLEQYNVRSIADVACGDFNWMKEVNLGDIQYTGIDIVEELVCENKRKYGRSNVRFLQLDICIDKIPPADLIICRDCLVHLGLRDAKSALQHIHASTAKYLLATTFTGVAENKEVVTGLWRPLNMQLPPFNLPQPELLIEEDGKEFDGKQLRKCLALWKLK